MNDRRRIDYQRSLIHQNHGIITDCNVFELGSRSFGNYNNSSSNMCCWVQQTDMDEFSRSTSSTTTQLQNSVVSQVKPSSTIISRFESPASAFYATERCMRGFPQYESQHTYSNNNNNNYSAINDSSSVHDDSSFDFGASPPSMAKTQFGPEPKLQFSVPLKENQDLPGYCNPFNSRLTQLSFEQQQNRNSNISPTVNSGGPVISSKTRIRWTQDLHEKFVECVNRLGGADKATPKAILKLMDSEGLTIFHVKSHLQKYRIAKYLPDSAEGKSEKVPINVTTQLEATAGLQIREALQLQLDVQRRLHEQLEVQRNLQLQIEEQGRQLKMMFYMQQRTSSSFFKSTQSSDITSAEDDEAEAPSNNSIDEFQVSNSEASGNTHFPSKIS